VKRNEKQSVTPERETFRAYEVFDGKIYRFSIFPGDGNPFELLEQEQQRNPNLRMIEVCEGVRREVAGPLELAPMEQDFDYSEEEEYED
jgi:hypothetical protein